MLDALSMQRRAETGNSMENQSDVLQLLQVPGTDERLPGNSTETTRTPAAEVPQQMRSPVNNQKEKTCLPRM
ncbi:MAG: hypothetical protein WCB10_05000 [Steroidobacteraceae bacterium]